jgi:hypothetical protein
MSSLLGREIDLMNDSTSWLPESEAELFRRRRKKFVDFTVLVVGAVQIGLIAVSGLKRKGKSQDQADHDNK